MNILLDTSAYSLLMRNHAGVRSVVEQSEEVVLTPVVFGELNAGFLRGQQTKRNRAELEEFLASPGVRMVDIDADTGELFAVIIHNLRLAGTPIPSNDVWIAASAVRHGLRLLTADRHFLKMPQVLVSLVEP
jgi:tRNA(fMet)-specific endonuclease VapC